MSELGERSGTVGTSDQRSAGQRRGLVSDWLSTLLVSALRGPSFAAGLLAVAAALLFGAIADRSGFLPGWADPFNFLLTSVLYLAPLAAGAAALSAVSLRRSGILSVAATAPNGRLRALLLALSSVLLWQLLALGVESIVLLLSSNLAGPFTLSMISIPVQAILLIVAVAGLSMSGALLWGSYASIPVAAFLTFGVLWISGLSTGSIAVFSLIFAATFYQVYFEPNLSLMAAHLGMTSGLLVGSISYFWSGRLRASVACVGAFLLIASVIATTQVDPSPVQFRAAPATPACARRDDIQLCVWPESKQVLPSALAALHMAVLSAQPLLSVPVAFEQPGLRAASAMGRRPDDVVTIQLPSQINSDRDLLFLAIRAVIPPPRCSGIRTTEAWLDIVDLLAARTGLDTDYGAMVADVLASPMEQQRAWVVTRMAIAHECSR